MQKKINCFPAQANPRKNKDKHLKQRPIPIQRAPDADRVEHLINAHLQQHGPKVADKPIQVETASRVRKDKIIWFQFRCFTCAPKSCTWSGRAQYDAGTSALKAWELSGRSHGALKQRKKAYGRKPKVQKPRW